MCTPILVERRFVVKAVKQFKELYPIASSRKYAMRWASVFVRDGRVNDNEDGSFLVESDSDKGLKYTVANKQCTCGFMQPCAHRIAVCIAHLAIQIRQATSEDEIEQSEVAENMAAEDKAEYHVAVFVPQIRFQPNDFQTESDEVLAVLREQEEHDG